MYWNLYSYLHLSQVIIFIGAIFVLLIMRQIIFTPKGFAALLSDPSSSSILLQLYAKQLSTDEFIEAMIIDMRKNQQLDPTIENRIRLYFQKLDEESRILTNRPFKDLRDFEKGQKLDGIMREKYPELTEGW